MIYKTTNFHNKIIPVILIGATFAAYYYELNPVVIGFVGLAAFTTSLNDHLSIIVDEDNFNIRYSNLFGRLMSTEDIFYYKDIKRFDYNTEQWKANIFQIIIMVIVGLFLPSRTGRISSKPKTTLTIVTKNILGETQDIEIVLETKDGEVMKALRIIKSKCNG